MKKRTRRKAPWLLWLGVAGALTAMRPGMASEPAPLNAAELESLLSGNSMAGNGRHREPAEPYDWMAYYETDGTIHMRLKPEWGGATDTGKWWITGKGELCRKFRKMAGGKQGCWLFYREGKFFRFVPSRGQAVEGRAAIIAGNLLNAPSE